jgi:RNA polymerase sigma-70 factor, ECF subfamily
MVNWTVTVNELGPRLYRYFLGSFAPDVAEELVQEVLVRVVRGWQAGSFDASKGTLAMWAFGMAHNVRLETLRILKKEAGFIKLRDEDSIEKIEAPAFIGESPYDLKVLRKAISQLPEAERQIVLLHIDDHLSLSEISSLLDMPVGTVKSHVHRAKENLKEILGENKKEIYE